VVYKYNSHQHRPRLEEGWCPEGCLDRFPDDQRCVSTTTYWGSVKPTTRNVLHFRNWLKRRLLAYTSRNQK